MIIIISCVDRKVENLREGDRTMSTLPAIFLSGSQVDLHIIRLRRLASFLVGTYFTTALMRFDSCQLYNFFMSDMRSIKHIMHAGFFWGGLASFWTTGNRRFLEICFAIFAFTTLPSGVALVSAIYNAYRHRIISNVLLALCGFAFSSSSAFFTYVLISVTSRSLEVSRSIAPAVRSVFLRLTSVHLSLQQEMGPKKFAEFERRRKAAYSSLLLEAIMHVFSNLLLLVLRLRFISRAQEGTFLSDFIPGYMDSLTLGLHWGFLFGNGVQGLRFASLGCIQIFTWGKFLLLVTKTLETLIASNSEIKSEDDNARLILMFFQVIIHTLTVVLMLRVQTLLSDTECAQEETRFTTHLDNFVNCDDSGVSVWERASNISIEECVKDPSLHAFRFYGKQAAAGATLCLALMFIESVLPVWFALGQAPVSSKADSILVTGASPSSSLGSSTSIAWQMNHSQYVSGMVTNAVTGAVTGMNFILHAVAVFLFGMYRPVRNPLQFHARKKFQVLSYGMFCALSLFQIFSVLSSSNSSPSTRAVIVGLNIFRLFVCLLSSTGFWSLPKQMPTIAQHNRQAVSKVEETRDQLAASEVDVNHVPPPIMENQANWRSTLQGSLCFDFVSWSTTYVQGRFKTRQIDILDSADVKQAIFRSDLSSRVLFYVNVVFIVCLIFGKYDQGRAYRNNGQGIDIGSHSLAFGITFHFLYILFGYSIRGGRAPHVPFLKFAGITSIGLALVSGSAAFALLSSGLDVQLGIVLLVQTGVFGWHSKNCLLSASFLRPFIHSSFHRKQHDWV